MQDVKNTPEFLSPMTDVKSEFLSPETPTPAARKCSLRGLDADGTSPMKED
jgi:hypothetical protein